MDGRTMVICILLHADDDELLERARAAIVNSRRNKNAFGRARFRQTAILPNLLLTKTFWPHTYCDYFELTKW